MKKRPSKAHRNKRSKYNVNSSGLNSELNQTIIYSLVIVAILVVFGALVIRFYRPEPSILGYENQDVWEEAFRQVEGNRVGVVFDDVPTTEKQYELLRHACNDFIEAGKNVEETEVSVNIKVNEEQFIDGNIDSELSNAQTNKDKADKVETGPIYFSDSMLIRYIDEHGVLNITFGIGTRNKDDITDIIVINQAELVGNEHFVVDSQNIETGNHGNYISESLFCYKIANSIKGLIEADNVTEERSAIAGCLEYFTQDGKDTILRYRNKLDLDSEDTIDIKAIAIGKSDTSKIIKDRIYLQYTLNNELVNMVVKLNSNLRVFDIDLLS